MEITKEEYDKQLTISFDVGFRSGMMMARKLINEELNSQCKPSAQ